MQLGASRLAALMQVMFDVRLERDTIGGLVERPGQGNNTQKRIV